MLLGRRGGPMQGWLLLVQQRPAHCGDKDTLCACMRHVATFQDNIWCGWRGNGEYCEGPTWEIVGWVARGRAASWLGACLPRLCSKGRASRCVTCSPGSSSLCTKPYRLCFSNIGAYVTHVVTAPCQGLIHAGVHLTVL